MEQGWTLDGPTSHLPVRVSGEVSADGDGARILAADGSTWR